MDANLFHFIFMITIYSNIQQLRCKDNFYFQKKTKEYYSHRHHFDVVPSIVRAKVRFPMES